MARHIDADQMIADTEAMKQVCEAIEIDGIIKYIEEHIAADVQEVKHGKWHDELYYPLTNAHYHTCSVCNKELKITFSDNYCPNCGAKMDGGGDE